MCLYMCYTRVALPRLVCTRALLIGSEGSLKLLKLFVFLHHREGTIKLTGLICHTEFYGGLCQISGDKT